MFGVASRIARRLGLRHAEFGSYVASGVKLGRGVHVSRGAEVWRQGEEVVDIGDHSFILRGTLLLPYGGSIRIGSNVGINPYCIIYGHGGVEIGNDVLIAAQVTLVSAQHVFERRDTPIRSQGITTKGIRIEDDVWIGAQVIVLDGVHIGRGAVVGAGSVVTRSVSAYQVVAGSPARVVRERASSSGLASA
jgi:acetyltransferase-like isoleucine patch superfamily enzyme